MKNSTTKPFNTANSNAMLGEEFYGKRLLSVTKYSIWNKIEYVIRLSGYLVISDGKLKSIFGSEKIFKRFDFDKKETNPFKKIGGYALNNIDLDELIFIEKLNCFIQKKYYHLIKNIELSDLKHTIWIDEKSEGYHFRIGFKRYVSEFFA